MPADETPGQKRQASYPLRPSLEVSKVEQIFADQIAQLGVRPAGGTAVYCEQDLHAVVAQTLTQDAMPDHPSSSEEVNLHVSSSNFRRLSTF
jgi:hypothetical protein